jgi:hypothetical protein
MVTAAYPRAGHESATVRRGRSSDVLSIGMRPMLIAASAVGLAAALLLRAGDARA